MKAMILAAGKGARDRPISNILPKPMIPLIRKPIMEAVIDHLKRHQFDEIFVNTSYMSRSIEEYFRDGDRLGVSIAYSYEGLLVNGQFSDQSAGSAGGIRRIQDRCGFFDDTFAVVCGNTLSNVNLTEVVRTHKERGALATIVTKLVPTHDVGRYGVVYSDKEGRVLQFQEKPSPADALSNAVSTGVYIFEPRIFDFIPAGRSFDIGSQLFPALVAAREQVYVSNLPCDWIDIASVADYWRATRRALAGQLEGIEMPGTEISPGVHVGLGVRMPEVGAFISGPVYIGSGTCIEVGVQIFGPTVIGANCELHSGAVVKQSILGDYTRVAADAFVDRRIVFAGRFIEPNGDFIDLHEADMEWLLSDARKPVVDEPMHRDLRGAMRSASTAGI